MDRPGDPHSPRPCLIISSDERNESADVNDFYSIVPIVSSLPSGPTRVPIQRGMGGLDHDSLLICEWVAPTTYKRFAPRRQDQPPGPLGGLVPIPVIKRVMQAIRIAMGDPTAR